MIHVLLTEKETSSGYYLKNIVKKNKKLNFVGLAQNSIEILYALIQQRVDLMIIDQSLKNINRSDCAGMVSKLNIDVKILLLLENEQELATHWNPDLFAGYILKTYSPLEILETIENVMNIKSQNYFIEKDEMARQAVLN